MTNELGMKELYEVCLKATYPIEVGGKKLETGEAVAVFDNIQLANFQEIKAHASANGGYDSRSLIIWDETKEMRLNFTQGVFSKKQLALMTNARLIKQDKAQVLISHRISMETDGEGKVELPYSPEGPIFVYDDNTGEKITNWERNDKIITLSQPYLNVTIDYQYIYGNNAIRLSIGEALTQGYLSLTGKMRVKDDITGQVTTGIINIPKLKLMSDLSMRLGRDAIPQVGRLDAVALPVGGKGNKKVMEIIFLEDDVDSDM